MVMTHVINKLFYNLGNMISKVLIHPIQMKIVIVVVVFIFQNLSSTSIGINIFLWASMYNINMGIKKHNNEMLMH